VTEKTVIAITNVPLGASSELGGIIEGMLEGARAAGSQTAHFVITNGGDARTMPETDCVTDAYTPESMSELVERARRADQLILGAAGAPRKPGSAFATFIDVCYERSRWMSLADVSGTEAGGLGIRGGGDPRDLKFPVPTRPVSEEHTGVVVVAPPEDAPDHDDPFCEDSFFVLEELERLLGFMPSGRILSTGLFYPPLEDNPILKQQAYEMGRRLAGAGAAGAPRE